MTAFHWLVALRYLRLEDPRSRRLQWIPAVFGVALVAVSLWSYLLDHGRSAPMGEVMGLRPALRMVKLGLLVGFVLVEAFVLMVRRLTLFTTISTYGLFLGSGALVIVLSVMSGFEGDLRRKILGTHAHVVVQRTEGAFTDYEAVLARLRRIPEVTGASPIITNEVMMASQSNLSGVVLKGIDPATAGQVTDLPRNIEVGDLDYLQHPDRLRTLGGPPILDDPEEPRPDGGAGGDAGARAAPAGVVHFGVADSHGRLQPTPEPPSERRRVVPGVVIGRELAKNLRLYLGDDVNVVSPLGGIGPQGPIPKSKPFRVAGIFYSGMFEYDTKYVYLALPAAQKFLDQPGEVNGIELKVRDSERTEPVVAAIERALGPGYEVQDWKALNRSLFSALKLEKIAMFVVLCFIILVAAFSIIANGVMLVMEKGREIAILKSMGASDRGILVVFLILGLYMGLLGTAAGIAIGILTCLGLSRFGLSLDPDVYYITQLPVRMNPYEIAAVFGAAIGIALLATLYPAWVAARLRPVEGLHSAGR